MSHVQRELRQVRLHIGGVDIPAAQGLGGEGMPLIPLAELST
jgi:hypothetical protein